MATPLCSLCRNVGWWRSLLLVACLNCWVVGKTQVANDDCAGAIALGVTLLPGSWHCDSAQMGTGFGTLFLDSTDLALPNFPYPSNPSVCYGYTTVVAAPAKDIWYAFRVPCDLTFKVLCDDTCHVSTWVGGNCASLYPGGCFTGLPNQPLYGAVNGISAIPLEDTLLLQVSSANLTSGVRFSLCVMSPSPPCSPTPIIWTDPTPTTCFTFSVSTMPCTGVGVNDGAATITMGYGKPPYQITWSDGPMNEFTRSGLAPGAYQYVITDSMGCSMGDSLEISVDTATGTPDPWRDTNSEETTFQRPIIPLQQLLDAWSSYERITILDVSGRIVIDSTYPQTPELQNGVYFGLLLTRTGRLVKCRILAFSGR